MAVTGILGACMCIDGVGYGVGMVEHRRPRGEGGVPKVKGGCFLGLWPGGGPCTPRAGGGGAGVRDKG